ncbi:MULTISPECIES: transglycosylase SLT domain-containing protein [Streptomyces]|uniref:transglycosylase SLT domain-containing protein n=1 Tax=Streptomyces TaxID=1883 RepID=UPI002248D276|nr:transglycosylase SLT domain-containing protein [Streptomyces sp. JHD 1]MCX2967636.1 transglycosylase SLT domain-containing protein [Streptomyces sp. JHD 1]
MPSIKPESKISTELRMAPEHLRNELPGYLRELQTNLKAVPGQLRQVPGHLRETPRHLRDVPAFARNLTRDQRHSAAVISGAAAAAVALTLVPTTSSADENRVVADGPANSAVLSEGLHGQLGDVQEQQEQAAERAADAKQAAEAKAEREREARAADRSKREAAPQQAPEQAPKAAEAPQQYPNNLDGWIREAMAIMDEHDIPGTYDRIKWNIMRESSGDPNAINDWDVNARNGVPSIGLLQVIKPTFDAYHVEGTEKSQWDPVANIVAACNYAADRYGSIDNVWSAY